MSDKTLSLSLQELLKDSFRNCLIELFKEECRVDYENLEVGLPDLGNKPIYNYTKAEVINLILATKTAESTFLPERWAYVWYKDNQNNCYKCSTNAKLHYPNLFSYMDCCYSERYTSFTGWDWDELEDLVINLDNYCSICCRPLYNIINIDVNPSLYLCQSCE
ncbi:PrGVORF101 -like protein [Hyphantria cunea granulovirus]|uniref:PrGVORF101-like protein n=1 Tax=Hyphantria cunea granulovirus TaxID=307448 RepID=A0AAF1D286_9BBAC|nr:PrGVORF101 -like protein [Hyphantria cunea granulovirus]QBQ01625.1 PrGVORF101 -like protein [Hyphantria cunea granulovirus]